MTRLLPAWSEKSAILIFVMDCIDSLEGFARRVEIDDFSTQLSFKRGGKNLVLGFVF